MNVWKSRKWTTLLTSNYRSGVRLRCDKDVNIEVKNACKAFLQWVRKEYSFPLRVNIYVKNVDFIRAQDGDLVYGTFFRPYEYTVEPYIKIAVGDYLSEKNELGRDDALASIICLLSHELTHYFQYINNEVLTPSGEERQASYYSVKILRQYATTREHP